MPATVPPGSVPGQLLVQRLGQGMQPDPRLFADLLNLMLDFRPAFPPQIAAVFRALITSTAP